MLTLPILWEISFSSFQMFVGVGIIWLLFIEPRFPSRGLSVAVMTVVALVAAALNFYLGMSQVRRQWDAAQKAISESESAAFEYEGEIA